MRRLVPGRTTVTICRPYGLDASSEQFGVPGGIGMSTELITVIVLALFAVMNSAVMRRGSFLVTPIWWRGKSGKGNFGKAGGP
jgi:hypothetical protein